MVKKYLHSPKIGFLYVRVRGKYLGRITADEGTAEFDRQYWDILSGKELKIRTSWTALIASYRGSDRWAKLKPRTRSDYEKVFLYLEDRMGNRDATRLIRKDIINAMEANRHRIRFANYLPQMMSILCEHAIDLGWMQSNPARGVRRLTTPECKKRPHIPWPDWAVEKWRAEANPLPRLIFEIGVGSVQRPGDWLKFRWSDYDGDRLLITQGKTKTTLHLPCTEALKAVLNMSPKKSLTILVRPDGSKMDYFYMARIMREERKRLALETYDLHALRYRGVMELAWAGCDDDEIAAYSGHSSKAMIRQYAGQARQIMRARQARAKRQ